VGRFSNLTIFWSRLAHSLQRQNELIKEEAEQQQLGIGSGNEPEDVSEDRLQEITEDLTELAGGSALVDVKEQLEELKLERSVGCCLLIKITLCMQRSNGIAMCMQRSNGAG